MIASPLKYVRCNQVVPAIVRLRCRQREPRERNVKRVGEYVFLPPFYDSVGPGIPSNQCRVLADGEVIDRTNQCRVLADGKMMDSQSPLDRSDHHPKKGTNFSTTSYAKTSMAALT